MKDDAASKDVKDLHICVVGAGMGGLAAALALAKQGFSHIHVYEAAVDLGFVGAGIQLAPNMARILDSFGCWEELFAKSVEMKQTSIVQHNTDKELVNVDLRYVETTYGYPHMVGHRADLTGALYNGCKQNPSITFHFSTALVSVESWSPRPHITLQPRDGASFTLSPDIFIASDGVKSVTRTAMLRELNVSASVLDTGQSAYRIMLTRGELQHDPQLLALIDADAATRWIGEKRHIIAYPISNKQIYNISTAQPDTNFAAAPSSTYTTKGSKEAMLECFADFCPRVQKLLALVPEGEVCEWKLRVHSPLPTWVHGCVALLGDACHPTLPHLAQGAAQAIEDAAVLAVVLASLPSSSASDIHTALQVYEDVRKVRAETLVELAAENGRALHLGEGKAREERDRAFQKLKEEGPGGGARVPDKWADAEVQKNVYGHDCQAVAAERIRQMFGIREPVTDPTAILQ